MARPVVEPEVAPPRLRMVYEQWRAWADDAEVKSEWVDGEVIVVMSTTIRHADVSGFLYKLLSLYAEFLNLGRVFAETVEMRLADRSRVPDLLFIRRDHLHRLTDQRLVGPADLVVEVVSDDSVARDREEKAREYAAAGVPEYWVLDARLGQERADVYRLIDGRYQAAPLDAEGRYHSAALPGFWLHPDWLRQDPLPNAALLLATIAPDAMRAMLAAIPGADRTDPA